MYFESNFYITYIFINLKIISAGVLNNLIDIKGNNAIKEVRILYQEPNPENIPRVYPLIRGLPLFAEIDFVPRYIPKFTHYVGVTVALPENVKTKQWIIGYHQEEFQIPKCRLCTNTNQSYTMPVTIYLADDGWCAQGRVPTLWKVEAIPLNRRYNDQTDMIIGLAYDKDKQIRIFNSNRTYHCFNKNEAVVY